MLNPMRIFPLSTNYSVTFYDIIMFNIEIFEHSPNCKTKQRWINLVKSGRLQQK